ncbi:MAG: ABC transporter ATP-binding protein [Acetivibrio sp.]
MKFEVKNGSFSYMDQEKKNVLSQINFSVEEGEILGILGKNGVGKTTLLRCSMGMLSWKEGKSYLDGKDIRQMKRQDIWSTMAYVPQAKNQYGQLLVEEMVLLGRSAYLKPWQQPGKKDKEIVEQAMEQTKTADLGHRSCSKLSGGELQMVLIARALAGEPKILVLDEPESNLDFKNQLFVLETMERLTRENHLSCIFNTHYPSHALQYAKKVLLLDNNGSSIFGEVNSLLTKENLERIFGVKVEIHEVLVDGKIFREVLPIEIIKD